MITPWPSTWTLILAGGARTRLQSLTTRIGWSDWGNPARVIASLRRAGREPDWLRHVELASTA